MWNDLLVALTFARETQPITVAIFSQMRQFSGNIDLIAPAAFVSLAIPLVVFFAFQRYFVQGLLAGLGEVVRARLASPYCARKPVSRGSTVSGLCGSPAGGSRLYSRGATSFGVSGWKSAARSWIWPRPGPSSHCPPP